MNQQQVNKLVTELYQAVDNKNVEYLKKNLSEKIRFRIGNNPAATDKALILEANSQFFNSIKLMRHTIEDVIWQKDDGSESDKIICHGRVDYVRLDGSDHDAVFSTALEVENGLVTDYLVFADLSGLFISV